MTEQEAYEALGWPTDGHVNSFILPCQNDESYDWVPYVCSNKDCPNPFRGLASRVFFESDHNCLTCGQPYTEIEQESKTDALRDNL